MEAGTEMKTYDVDFYNSAAPWAKDILRDMVESNGFKLRETTRVDVSDDRIVIYTNAVDDEGHFMYDPEAKDVKRNEPVTIWKNAK
jgi:hypothetical protein